MAVDTLSITRPTSQLTSLDYQKLYEEGIAHIQNLSGKLWTDYNAHDPGITILELMCYAITELGYRCDYEVKDLIEPSPDEVVVNDFFTLAQVGSNAPLTITDYRKIIIDRQDIRNAWLEKAERGETYLAISRNQDILYAWGSAETIPVDQTEVKLRGLYNAYVQFEEDPDFGDLNDNSIQGSFYLNLVGQEDPVLITAELEFPLYETLVPEFDAIAARVDIEGFSLQLAALTVVDENNFVFSATFELNSEDRAVTMEVVIRVISGTESVLNKIDFRNQLEREFLNSPDATLPLVYDPAQPLYTYTEAIKILLHYTHRHQRIHTLLTEVADSLAEHRNLCEDFMNIYPMSLQEIGLTLQMEVEPGADLEEICAEVYYQTEQYLNPNIQFYSLREMLDKGYEPEEIFRGPTLANGFLDEGELSFQQQRDTLYISDLIHAFMDIDGVKTIQNISLSRYKEGRLVDENRTECLRLENPQARLPRLNFSRSSVKLDNGSGTPQSPDQADTLDILSERKALNQLKGNTGDNDFALPNGTYAAFSDYYSIQHEFPGNYAIGVEGLAPDETDQRKGQAQQLKAYLLFFEQLLANFMSQLSNVRKLYSFQNEVDRTYYTQMLLQVPRVQTLVRDFTDANGSISWQDYADYGTLGRDTHYQYALDEAAESNPAFQDRRKRFLDHLLARFNESFTDYAAYVFATQYDEATQYSNVITDQVRFLQNYVSHSHDRATAFDYRDTPVNPVEPSDFWDPARVPGLKKRITYLAGLPNVSAQWINPYDQFSYGAFPTAFTLLNTDGIPMMVSASTYPDLAALLDAIDLVYAYGTTPAQYVTEPLPGTATHLFAAPGDPPLMLLDSEHIALAGGVSEAVSRIMDRLEAAAQVENLHIVEHILLRPRESGDVTLAVRDYNDCLEQSITDPYSFRISIVLPTWAGRFQEIAYRRMIKKMLRMEAPAHVYIHFHWINAREMYDFEHCWLDWLNGEWFSRDSRLMQENAAFLLQENKYYLLVERDRAAGGDGIYFADCLSHLPNRYDAYYIMEPARIVDQYRDCDLIGRPVDPDGEIIRAWIPTGQAIPPGLCIHPCTGAIHVQDQDLLAKDISEYTLSVFTLNAGGEITTHDVLIQFIPNGPATIVPPGPVSKHINLWQDGDTIVQFIDMDGATDDSNGIIMATLINVAINGVQQGLALPAGIEMDPLSGQFKVSNHNALVPATYTFTVSLMDSKGGTTEITFTFNVIPDTEAVVSSEAPKNEDAYNTGDLIATISDNADEGIATLVPRSNQVTPLAQYGLEIVYPNVDPPTAEIRVVDASQFRTALPGYYPLNVQTGFYEATLRLTSTDLSFGQTDLDLLVRVRPDAIPTVSVNPPRNLDAYLNGDILASISDNIDSGIQSLSEPSGLTPSLATRGIKLEVGTGDIGHVKVLDAATFKAFLGALVPTSVDTFVTTFTVDTVDKTLGRHTVSVTITVKEDREPKVETITPRLIDTYLVSDLVASIHDEDTGGVTFVQEVSSAFPTLANMGLGVQYGNVVGHVGNAARIYVQNLSLFRTAVNNSIGFALVDAATQLYRLTKAMKVTDASGGTGTVSLVVEVFQDRDAIAKEEKNGISAEQYLVGDVLWRFTDADNGVSALQLISGSLPGFLGFSINSITHEGVIRVTNTNVTAIDQSITVRVTDNRPGMPKGTTDIPLRLLILQRVINLDFQFSTGGSSKALGFTASYPTLVIDQAVIAPGPILVASRVGPGGTSIPGIVVNPLPSASFGTVQRLSGTSVVFSPGSGFVGAIGIRTFEFDGHFIHTGEQVTVLFNIAYQQVNVPGDFNNIRTGITTNPKGRNTSLKSLTNEVITNVSKGRTFEDNPLLKTNPRAVGSLMTGKRDTSVTTDFVNLMEATTEEIERLKSVVTSTTGSAQEQARKDLQIAADLYQTQLMGAIMFAGEVRSADLGEDDPVKTLFDSINNQLKRIQ